MPAPNNIQLMGFAAEFAVDVVKMWRRSFQRAMGLEEHNRYGELRGQLDYFRTLQKHYVRIAIQPESSKVVGFMVLEDAFDVSQLYIDTDEQGKGYGSFLLNDARQRCDGRLELHTFQRNSRAQAFYLRQGFVEIARGYADLASNPWTTNVNDLADIQYRWDASQLEES